MTDIVDKRVRSRMMSGIRGMNTKPELMVRRHLHAAGLRFRLHEKSLSGKPDLVLRRWNAVVFVHGCFWHRHEGCRYTTNPATRPEFWADKFKQNEVRDQRNKWELREDGWRVAIVWECALKAHNRDKVLNQLVEWIRSDSNVFETALAALQ